MKNDEVYICLIDSNHNESGYYKMKIEKINFNVGEISNLDYGFNLYSYVYLNTIKIFDGVSSLKAIGRDVFLVRASSFKDKVLEETHDKKPYKVLKAYRRHNKYTKFRASMGAMKFQKLDLLPIIISLIVMFIGLTITIIEKQNKVLILTLSLLTIFLNLINLLVKKIKNFISFYQNCTLTSQVEGLPKDVINNELMNLSHLYSSFRFIKYETDGVLNDIFMVSDYENKNFDSNASVINFKLRKFKHIISDSSRLALSNIIQTKIDDDKAIFNGHLVGISTDLNFSRQKEVLIKEVRYHDYVATDEMVYKNITLATNPHVYIKGVDFAQNPVTKTLRDIKSSPLTNLIGVNILIKVIYKDSEYYLVNIQSNYNDVNGGLLVPSGSGSLDIKDCISRRFFKNKPSSFKELLVTGMLRELSEESKINEFSDIIKNVKLIGFSRLLSKGGKPDFFGVSEIYVDDISKLFKNYNDSVNKHLKSRGFKNYSKYALENYLMYLVPKDKLLNDNSFSMSPQLRYMIDLIKGV